MNRVYNVKTDVWSFGVVIFEIMAKTDPYPGLDPIGGNRVCINLYLQLVSALQMEI